MVHRCKHVNRGRWLKESWTQKDSSHPPSLPQSVATLVAVGELALVASTMVVAGWSRRTRPSEDFSLSSALSPNLPFKAEVLVLSLAVGW